MSMLCFANMLSVKTGVYRKQWNWILSKEWAGSSKFYILVLIQLYFPCET